MHRVIHQPRSWQWWLERAHGHCWVFLLLCSDQQESIGFRLGFFPSSFSIQAGETAWLVRSNHEQGVNASGGEGHVLVASWEKSREQRDVAYLQGRAAHSLSQFVCLSVGSGQLQHEVRMHMVRNKGVGAFLHRSSLGGTSSDLQLSARGEEGMLLVGSRLAPRRLLCRDRAFCGHLFAQAICKAGRSCP